LTGQQTGRCAALSLNRLVAALAVAVLWTGVLSACSSQQTPQDVTLSKNLTVALPPGSPQVRARSVPAAAGSPLLRALAEPEHMEASGRLPGRAVLTFHVGHVTGRPFLAWLDGGTWIPVPSRYDASAGTVSATVTHFSTWAPFTWVTSRLNAWLGAALRNVFGLGTATSPECTAPPLAEVTDSNPRHHTIGVCAEAAPAWPAGAIALIANLRGYPVDLLYPAAAAGRCGEYGPCVHVAPSADPWLRVGAALSPGSNKILIPGSGTASVVVTVPPGKAAVLESAVDTPAMFMAFLQAGISVFTTIVGVKLKAIGTVGDAIDALAASQCVSQDWQQAGSQLDLAAAVHLATTAFGCLSSVLPEVLDKLGLKATGLVLGAFGAATGFVGAAVSSLWGLYDQFFGTHVLTISLGRTVSPAGCGTVHDSLVNSTVSVSVARGSITCTTALSIVNTYYNHPPEPYQGSSGFVQIGPWQCRSEPGAVAESTGHDGDCLSSQGHISINRP
jgi:hypothetical protein